MGWEQTQGSWSPAVVTWQRALILIHSAYLFTPDEDLAPKNLSDLPKATKGASMDKRQEKYLGGTWLCCLCLKEPLSVSRIQAERTRHLPLSFAVAVCFDLLLPEQLPNYHDSKMKTYRCQCQTMAQENLKESLTNLQFVLGILNTYV